MIYTCKKRILIYSCHFTDTNGNGTLELDEVKECFKELHISFTNEEIGNFYAESDMDASSGIDFKEFIVLLALVQFSFDKSDVSTSGCCLKMKFTFEFSITPFYIFILFT